LDESAEEESEVVAHVDPMLLHSISLEIGIKCTGSYPKSASPKGEHSATKARLLALWRDAPIDTVAKPHVCVYVPAVEEHFEIGRKLNVLDVDVRCAVPSRLAGGRVSIKTESSQDRRTLKYLKVSLCSSEFSNVSRTSVSNQTP
jgi:hypothetical protein